MQQSLITTVHRRPYGSISGGGPSGSYAYPRTTLPQNYTFNQFTGKFEQQTPGWYIGAIPAARTATADRIVTNNAEMGSALTAAASATGNFVIEIAAGTNLTVTNSSGIAIPQTGARAGWLIIRGAGGYGSYPSNIGSLRGGWANGSYVRPSHFAGPSARIQAHATSNRILTVGSNTDRVWFENIEFYGNNTSDWLIYFGYNVTNVANIPTYLAMVNCYVHGNPATTAQRGVICDGDYQFFFGNYMSDFKLNTSEPQALYSLAKRNGHMESVNNFISGAGENYMSGGADPRIGGVGLNPQHEMWAYNYIYKDPAWKALNANVKCLFELKQMEYFLMFGCILDGCWASGQQGMAIDIKTTNQVNTSPFSRTQHINMRYNVIRNSGAFVQVLGYDATNFPVTQRTNDVELRDFLMYNMNTPTFNGSFYQAEIVTGALRVWLDHLTHVCVNNPQGWIWADAANDVHMINSIMRRGSFGIAANNLGEGSNAINTSWPVNEFRRNAYVGNTSGALYAGHPDNFFLLNDAAVGFVDQANGNYDLMSAAYNGGIGGLNAGTDGKNLGCDISRVLAETAGVDS